MNTGVSLTRHGRPSARASPIGREGEFATLLLATGTDHSYIRHRQIAGFLCVFVHRGLYVFLHPVSSGTFYYADNFDGMPNMFSEFDAVAFEIPLAAVLRSKVELFGIITFRETPG